MEASRKEGIFLKGENADLRSPSFIQGVLCRQAAKHGMWITACLWQGSTYHRVNEKDKDNTIFDKIIFV